MKSFHSIYEVYFLQKVSVMRGHNLALKVDISDPGSSLSTRYIAIDDRSQAQRAEYLAHLVAIDNVFPFGEANTYAISSECYYDVLFIGGEDTARIARFVRNNSKFLAGRLIIILTSRSSPVKRTRLLKAGCDDVIDVGRMHIEEAKARLAAHVRRSEVYRSIANEADKRLADIGQVITVVKTKNRDMLIVECLLASKPAVVSYAKIQTLMGDVNQTITDNNMKVFMSILRKKLRPGWEIKAESGVGYRLIQTAVSIK